MKTLRLFIAVDLPQEVKTLLEQQQAALLRGLPFKAVRWSNPEQLHLTLLFLGQVDPNRVQLISQNIDYACRRQRAFALETAHPGAFPSLERPSVLYTGVAGNVTALNALVASLSDQLYGLYEPSGRRFKPHLTLGRVKEEGAQERIARALKGVPTFYPAAWRVETVHLISSTLTPQGAQYNTLYTGMLAT